MTYRRAAATTFAAFLVSQIIAIVVHGFILAADYAPFYGNLLRDQSGDPGWPALLLPVSHLCFVSGLVWIYGRLSLDGSSIESRTEARRRRLAHRPGSAVVHLVRRTAVAGRSRGQAARSRAAVVGRRLASTIAFVSRQPGDAGGATNGDRVGRRVRRPTGERVVG